MSLRPKETMDAFIDAIIYNKEIMDILKLPVILETDTKEIINKKRKTAIDKVITKTAQNPYELDKKFPTVKFDDKEYSDFGKIRISISYAQSIKLNSDIFGNPQIDINIYYDNTTEMDNVFELLGLLSDLFSNQNLEIKLKDEKIMIKNIKNEVITSQIAVINNYERIGMRFSYFATLYKN
mgnify:CR=1 FL=1